MAEDVGLAASAVAVDAHFSIAFLTALVGEELISCETALANAGWNRELVSPELEDACISGWTKTIDGRLIRAYSGAIGSMGQSASAIETLALLDRVRPTYAFLTGIAGSLRDSWVHKCDVVVGTEVLWWAQNRVFGAGRCDEYRRQQFPLTPYQVGLRNRIMRWTAETYPQVTRGPKYTGDFNVHAGGIFTWEYVIDSERIVQEVNEFASQGICVEMEGGGFVAGVQRHSELRGGRPVKSFIVRGISDYARKKDSIPAIRTAASLNAATVAVALAEWMTTTQISRDLRPGVDGEAA